MTRAVLYIRVSTDRQELSPEAQEADMRAWCERESLSVHSSHEDIGISGGAPLDHRPGLLAALDALPKGGILLVAKRDRLARDVLTAAMVESLVARKGAKLATVDGAGNGAAPEDKLMRQMVDAFAEYERALIGSRTRAALKLKKAKGELTGTAPFGKRLGPDGVHLEDDPAELVMLEQARTIRGEGGTLQAVADGLNQAGFKTRNGGEWHRQGVHRMLRAA